MLLTSKFLYSHLPLPPFVCRCCSKCRCRNPQSDVLILNCTWFCNWRIFFFSKSRFTYCIDPLWNASRDIAEQHNAFVFLSAWRLMSACQIKLPVLITIPAGRYANMSLPLTANSLRHCPLCEIVSSDAVNRQIFTRLPLSSVLTACLPSCRKTIFFESTWHMERCLAVDKKDIRR